MAHNKTFVQWLQNAYGMEKQLIEVLEAHRDQAEGHPDVQAKISEHLAQTKMHEEHVEKCLRDLGEEPSGLKAVWGGLKGNMEGAASALPADKVIQNGICDYATEYYEIAVYSGIIAAAEHLGHPEIAKVCNEIKKEEQAMADWLEQKLPSAVEGYLDEKMKEDESDN